MGNTLNDKNPTGIKPDQKVCIIVDIDGTVADCSHRRHLVDKNFQASEKNWKLFCSSELVAQDKVIEAVREAITAIVEGFANTLDVFYVSGRGADTWQTTKDWLTANDLWFDSGTQLWCRGIGDARHDVDFKRECLQKIRMTHRVMCCFDDRNSVVAMWREEGLICFQVAEGDF